MRYNVKVENCGSAKLEFSWEEGNDSACHPFPVVLPKCSSPDLRVGSSKPLAAAEGYLFSHRGSERKHSQSVLFPLSLHSKTAPKKTVIRTTCSVLYETHPSTTILAPIQYAELEFFSVLSLFNFQGPPESSFNTGVSPLYCISTPWITIYATCKQQ